MATSNVGVEPCREDGNNCIGCNARNGAVGDVRIQRTYTALCANCLIALRESINAFLGVR